MIYVTGDIHGNPSRLKKDNLAKVGIEIKADDYVIICGDFGLLWGGKYQKEADWWLEWLNDKPFTTLFVDGNHENFEMLNALPVENWQGGKVHKVRENVLHLMRGEIFTIEGKTFFCFGGATSTDKEDRKAGVTWWKQENPSIAEFDNALFNLEQHDFSVDYVITHTAPKRFLFTVPEAVGRVVDCTNSKMLAEMEKYMNYKKWYFGHFHIDYCRPDSNEVWMYKKIVRIED